MKRIICLLMAAALLLTGCGGSTPAETEAPATETTVTTEPTTEATTVPTEPKTFFEEQGFIFWKDFEVHETLDDAGNLVGRIAAEASIPDSNECKITIITKDNEKTTYHLADTKVEVFMDEYTLAEFEEVCKAKKLSTENIKNASDNMFKAFKEEDKNLTKGAWLEKYQDYKIIHGQFTQQIMTARELLEAKWAMNVGQNQWKYKISNKGESMVLLNCIDGSIYDTTDVEYLGVAETFPTMTETGTEIMAILADWRTEYRKAGTAKDLWFLEDLFVMVPEECDDLVFVLPLVEKERTLEVFETDNDEYAEVPQNAWEEKTFAEYAEGKDHLKYYFLSPYHH